VRKSSKLVFGLGLNNGRYLSVLEKTMLCEYKTWRNMILRCTDKWQIKYPTYKGVTCSENFKNYEYFYEWCQTQVGFKNKDEHDRYWHLDKDLLVKGNKLYSEDTCVFVPSRINSLLNKLVKSRGEYPIGVCFCNTKRAFFASCGLGDGRSKNLGLHCTSELAFQAYKLFKEDLIKQVAKDYKPQLDPRAYQALMNYEVNIND